MPIGKNSINRVAAGLDSENAAPMTVPTAVEQTIVEGTAEAAAEAPVTTPTEVETAIVEGTAEKATKKTTTARKPRTKKTETSAEAAPAETAVAPELVGQAVAAPAARRRDRKPGSKNKKTVVAKKPAATTTRKANRIPRAPETAKSFLAVAIGEDLPVYLL